MRPVPVTSSTIGCDTVPCDFSPGGNITGQEPY
jgi:hypothetical protein